MTFPILLIAVFLLGLALVGALKEGETKIGIALTVIIISMLSLYILAFGVESKTEAISKGEYYSTQCQLIETNIDNGIFQSSTNKLKCGDAIENVTVSDYKEAIEAYQNSNVQMNKLN
ncbi:hypothetical protein HMPREF1563_0328 [Providencia alcalifaciens 205/92]|uniref:Uncharacterized protein n=2 Tax=Providencia alcalifaciens TaxID=126385 RepID=A0AAV3M8N1_9GAMM|nr:hypothetical protein HMPREF1563_0328 [Providencia alcalifaciens 205/92]